MKTRGFTLLEVLIALMILAISLTVLLQAQASSLANAARSRDVTIATLLARSKLIDIERKLFHEGFVTNSEDEDGDFRDEGHEEVKWKYRVSDIQLDLSSLSALCGVLGGGDQGGKKGGKSSSKSGNPNGMGNDCETMLSGLSGPMSQFTTELSNSMRALDLFVSWPEGDYKKSFSVHALLTRDDFQTSQDTDATKAQDAAVGAAKAAGMGVPGGQPPMVSH